MPYIGNRQSLRTDKYLTNLSQQTAQENSVADFVAPPIPVKQDTGRYRIHSRINTHRTLNDRISKGMKPRQIETDYGFSTYTLAKYGLSDYIHDEDQRNMEGLDLARDTAMNLATLHLLARENRTATNALAALTASGNTAIVGVKWNVAGGTPISDITNRKIVVLGGQVRANAFVTTEEVALGLTLTTEWRNFFTVALPHAQRALFDPLVGLNMLNIETRVAGMCELTSLQGTASDPDEFARVWANTAILFTRVPRATLLVDTFMYAPNLYQDRVRTARGEEEEKQDASYVEIKSERTNLVINNQAGWYFNAPN